MVPQGINYAYEPLGALADLISSDVLDPTSLQVQPLSDCFVPRGGLHLLLTKLYSGRACPTTTTLHPAPFQRHQQREGAFRGTGLVDGQLWVDGVHSACAIFHSCSLPSLVLATQSQLQRSECVSNGCRDDRGMALHGETDGGCLS